MKAPHFELLDQDGKTHSLADYAGSWLVIYFYPKDDTPGCTKEACSFRDAYSNFLKNDINVLGVSKDTVSSHQKFSHTFALPFPLLSDPDHSMLASFGAWGKKTFMGKLFYGILRKTFIINPHGEIVKIYDDVDPAMHADEVLHDIQKLQNN